MIRIDAIWLATERMDMRAGIVAGFVSDALGRAHTYDSQLEDQLNLNGVILSGADSG
ncbi:transposase [Pseudomonas sp. H3(2019)]|uniref:transposase n=1 Tax=Pseudomonas sp. H3(2019) TaxID=2598724 RepID=UPI0011952040|nr:transposase [Pseudomonas sp. H3(2019)]TVT80970.1 transposase [Pseudomonas sp. H3(2019)]